MRQLLRESSIVRNNYTSSLLRITFLSGKCYDQAWVLFLGGGSDGDHVGGSFLYMLAIKLHQTGKKEVQFVE